MLNVCDDEGKDRRSVIEVMQHLWEAVLFLFFPLLLEQRRVVMVVIVVVVVAGCCLDLSFSCICCC